MTSVEELPTGVEKARAVRAMFDTIAPRYDLLNRLLTFRLDVGWRRRAVRSLSPAVASGGRVVDVACGTGDLCRELAHHGHMPIGVDVSAGMLAAARTDASLLQADALAMPLADASVDGVTCGFALRNFTSLEPALREMSRVVRAGGRIALLEVAEPPNRLLRWGHAIYFGRVVPFVGGLLSDRAAYRYLPRSVAYLPPTEDLLALVERSGFVDVTRTALSGGIAQLIVGTRP